MHPLLSFFEDNTGLKQFADNMQRNNVFMKRNRADNRGLSNHIKFQKNLAKTVVSFGS